MLRHFASAFGTQLFKPFERATPFDCGGRNAHTRAAGYVLGKLLETMRQRVCTATDETEALESVRRERPDLMISDIGMPNIDGYELARRLRRNRIRRS